MVVPVLCHECPNDWELSSENEHAFWKSTPLTFVSIYLLYTGLNKLGCSESIKDFNFILSSLFFK